MNVPKKLAKEIWQDAERTVFTEHGQQYLKMYKNYIKDVEKANKRLQRIDKYAGQEFYKGIKRLNTYKNAMHSIKSYGGKDRFSKKSPESMRDLQNRYGAVKAFLDSPVSTKRGITESYVKMANTINDDYGTNFKWQELARFYESSEAEKYSTGYGSLTLLYALADVKKFKEKYSSDDSKISLKNAIKMALDGDLSISGDEVDNEIAKELLEFAIKKVFK